MCLLHIVIASPSQTCVARLVWPDLCGQACVARLVWPDMCGQTCVARFGVSYSVIGIEMPIPIL